VQCSTEPIQQTLDGTIEFLVVACVLRQTLSYGACWSAARQQRTTDRRGEQAWSLHVTSPLYCRNASGDGTTWDSSHFIYLLIEQQLIAVKQVEPSLW